MITAYIMNRQRITVRIDKDLERKLRLLQAKGIIKVNEPIIFSEIVHEFLKKSLEK